MPRSSYSCTPIKISQLPVYNSRTQNSVADVRFGPVFCQNFRTPNLTWGPVRAKWVNPEPNIGPVHQGFGSGSEQVRTSKNRKFFLLDLDIKTVRKSSWWSCPGGRATVMTTGGSYFGWNEPKCRPFLRDMHKGYPR
jgi:hypothetical protein